jgi:uncharacterized RmlC-like cupin family protein
MTEIEIVKKNDLQAGASTPGILREAAFKTESLLFIRATTSNEDSPSAWHHHAQHDVYGYVVSGRIRFEYGPEGKSVAEAGPGDFFHVPAGVVHRETPGKETGHVIIAFVGTGPLAVNVENPEP